MAMRLFDPRLMRLLAFLTRRQAWLTAEEVARDFRLDGSKPTARTIHRWFRFLREQGGFVYYPYPRANVLGLQDVLLRVRDVRNPAVFGILPFAASFNVEVELGTGRRLVSQAYWVPGHALHAFHEYWRTASDLDLIGEFDLLRCRNTHYVFSPFHQLITKEGAAELHGPADNKYFESLIQRDLRHPFEVRLLEGIARSPLMIPIVVEHIWSHYSSRHVWQAIREKGEARILAYGKRLASDVLQKPGAALRLLQQQWADVLQNFEETFLQPRVFLDWTPLRHAMYVSVLLKPGSPGRAVEAAIRVSEKSISTAVKLGVPFEERCHINCFAPHDQLLPILEIARDHHRGQEPAAVSIQDKKATLELFQPTYCKLDWRLFDPASLSWRFDGEGYVERLKGLES